MNASAYGPDEARGVWVHLEQEGGEFEGVTRELLGKGRELADARHAPLVGLLLGADVGHLAHEATTWGADEVVLAEDPRLQPYTTDAHTQVAAALVLDGKPEILLLGATPNGRDLAGRLAVRLRTGLTADCTDLDLEPETGLLLSEVAGFGGGIVATIACREHRPQMATVRPGVFAVPEADPSRRGTVRSAPVRFWDADPRVRVLERSVQRDADLTAAEVLVVAGGGTGGNLTLLRELADLLGAELGATRVAVDAGWATHEQQVGQTGFVTRPKLAIVCGASGALQFTVGIEQAETVVAVNIDCEAPIFEAADYCIEGDLFEVVQALIGEIRESRQTSAAVVS